VDLVQQENKKNKIKKIIKIKTALNKTISEKLNIYEKNKF